MTTEPALETERVPCPACGADQPTLLMLTRDRMCGVPGAFALQRCGRCAQVYLSPRPSLSAMPAYYPAHYFPHAGVPLHRQRRLTQWLRRYGLRRRCRAVPELRRGGNLLDVGCGTGEFLTEMRRYRGWQVQGLESGQRAAAFARQEYGLAVETADLATTALPAGHFDVITMWDVLEHLPDPAGGLATVARLLKPGGRLVLRTPNRRSVAARVFGKYWAGYDSPRHLTVFDPATLEALLRKSGFTLESWRAGGSEQAMVSISLQFKREAGNKLATILLKTLDSLPLQALLAVPFALVGRIGLASEQLVTAQKQVSR